MSRKQKNYPLQTDVRIIDMAAEGKAIGKVDDQVVFVPFAAPGDICDVQIVKKKRSYLEGRITQIKEASPLRTKPRCSHFGVCGGCRWQHVSYDRQLEHKQQQVKDAMTRLGKVNIGEYLPIVGAPEQYRYRNKLEFSFSNRRWLLPGEFTPEEMAEGSAAQEYALGFHIPGRFDKVLNIDRCYIGSDLSDDIRLFIRDYCLARKEKYPFFDLLKQNGFIRTLLIRTTSVRETMVLVVFYEEREDERLMLLKAVRGAFPQITALLYAINPKCNDTITDLPIEIFSGRDYIMEEMEGLHFRIGPKSFYQTNSQQAYALYNVVRDFAGLTSGDIVYDLYTGTGTIANFVAKQAKKVIGIEYVEEAIADAHTNSSFNKLQNTAFFAGDMKDVLNAEFIEREGKPDVVITDPPRAGMHENVIKTILATAPQRIVYVSCNPATQARDLSLLTASGDYCIKYSRAVDMFPHTHHIENVVLLNKIR